MRKKYEVQIKMLLAMLFILISVVALFSKINELEFKHVVGIFMLGVAFIGINNIMFKKKNNGRTRMEL